MKPNKRIALSLIAAVSVATLVACSKQEAPKTEAPAAPAAAPAVAPAAPAATAAAPAEPKALFEQKCSICHTVERATSRKETREAWVALVKKMQAKQPGSISDDDATRIVDFLTAEHGKK
ncbi:MAG TPA: cytochrome c [Candidatus Deferrimicrobiaceae bacterium]